MVFVFFFVNYGIFSANMWNFTNIGEEAEPTFYVVSNLEKIDVINSGIIFVFFSFDFFYNLRDSFANTYNLRDSFANTSKIGWWSVTNIIGDNGRVTLLSRKF